MPQLDIIAYSSELFWFFMIFSSIYLKLLSFSEKYNYFQNNFSKSFETNISIETINKVSDSYRNFIEKNNSSSENENKDFIGYISTSNINIYE